VNAPLLVVAFLEELGQNISRIAVAGGSEPSQFADVAFLARQLDQLIGGVGPAVVGEVAQLVHVTPLAGQLDELGYGIAVSGRGAPAQVEQFVVSHSARLPRT
jgi:hypothetical protein